MYPRLVIRTVSLNSIIIGIMVPPSFQDILESVRVKWKTSGITCNPGASVAELRILEQAVDFTFDDAFGTYLRQINGFADFGWDETLFSFWSTTRIKEELNDCHPAELICFADYSINAGSFGFHRQQGDHGVYLHFQTVSGLWRVADSFSDLLQSYLLDPNSLLR
jgi:hypothetical protein